MSQHKIVILADLHMDQWEARSFIPNPLTAMMKDLPEDFSAPELVVSAGDLAHARPFGWSYGIRAVRGGFPTGTPLLFMPGNHDYYGAPLDDAPLAAECALRKVGFGQKTEVHVGATRILVCTLWSDGLLFGEDNRAETLRLVQRSLNDYNWITRPGTPQKITTADIVALHEDHLAWLEGKLAQKHDGPTMIITHHGPHPEASLPADAISAGFVSDLSRVIEEHQPDAWVFGHTHRPQSAILGKTRIHNVGVGYPHEAKEYGLASLLLRGCVEVGDEIRFVMDERDPRPVRVISTEGPRP